MTTAQPQPVIDTVIFDLGGVLIDWNPRYLFRKLFGADVVAMEHFLREVCNTEWNEQQDAGRSWADAVQEAIARHPSQELMIRAYHERWHEMIAGAFDDTVAVLDELRTKGIRILALTNWSHETFPVALARFPFLHWFEGVLVSGTEGVKKPDPAIFALMIARYGIQAQRAVFIDDLTRNTDAAQAAGLHGIHFTGAQQLRADLRAFGLPLNPDANP